MVSKVRMIKIWLQNCSMPIIRENVECYTKGNMYCVYHRDIESVEKFPLCSIFKVTELNPEG